MDPFVPLVLLCFPGEAMKDVLCGIEIRRVSLKGLRTGFPIALEDMIAVILRQRHSYFLTRAYRTIRTNPNALQILGAGVLLPAITSQTYCSEK